ncbi:unnamed protein product [Paramecium sonneborni]|uniref:Uncharacterized protein n=1 Tax=Paramecium sonneborni TaxID=65129 RepID=A0A8S1RNB7_9CILI|nr:unnamed protein product [Paramecium sonneborni]
MCQNQVHQYNVVSNFNQQARALYLKTQQQFLIILYIQFVIFKLQIQQQNQAFNNSMSYPNFIYNYNVTSALNDTALQQTPNQSITFYSNLTIIQNLTSISPHIAPDNIIPQSKNFTYPMNLFLESRIMLSKQHILIKQILQSNLNFQLFQQHSQYSQLLLNYFNKQRIFRLTFTLKLQIVIQLINLILITQIQI